MVIDEIDDLQKNRQAPAHLFREGLLRSASTRRREHDIDNIAIARIEQLYPFPKQQLSKLVDGYPNVEDVVWVQEEPRNQGACAYLLESLNLFGSLNEEPAVPDRCPALFRLTGGGNAVTAHGTTTATGEGGTAAGRHQ
ncbi:MAG: hypothetical protein U5P41_12615 [Gammaproteobacteria bacterium]|nr:hypothetical protein [Gammaproteobacteria bacterium]